MTSNLLKMVFALSILITTCVVLYAAALVLANCDAMVVRGIFKLECVKR